MRARLLIATFLAAASQAGSIARADDPGPYVALGDSYTAAPLVPNLVGRPAG